jgi:hypothetical protein
MLEDYGPHLGHNKTTLEGGMMYVRNVTLD